MEIATSLIEEIQQYDVEHGDMCRLIVNENGKKKYVFLDVGPYKESKRHYIGMDKNLPCTVLITHGHEDHYEGILNLKEYNFNVEKIIIGKLDSLPLEKFVTENIEKVKTLVLENEIDEVKKYLKEYSICHGQKEAIKLYNKLGLNQRKEYTQQEIRDFYTSTKKFLIEDIKKIISNFSMNPDKDAKSYADNFFKFQRKIASVSNVQQVNEEEFDVYGLKVNTFMFDKKGYIDYISSMSKEEIVEYFCLDYGEEKLSYKNSEQRRKFLEWQKYFSRYPFKDNKHDDEEQHILTNKTTKKDIISWLKEAVYSLDPNQDNMTIRIEDNTGYAILITGDQELPQEKDALRRKLDQSCNYLKLAHHGSTSSNSYEYLKYICNHSNDNIIAVVSSNIDDWEKYNKNIEDKRLTLTNKAGKIFLPLYGTYQNKGEVQICIRKDMYGQILFRNQTVVEEADKRLEKLREKEKELDDLLMFGKKSTKEWAIEKQENRKEIERLKNTIKEGVSLDEELRTSFENKRGIISYDRVDR